jgi:hypothetical protein
MLLRAGRFCSKLREGSSMIDETAPDRAELMTARELLKRQLGIVENPLRASDYNPQLAARLEAMIEEIDNCLADLGEAGAKGA